MNDYRNYQRRKQRQKNGKCRLDQRIKNGLKKKKLITKEQFLTQQRLNRMSKLLEDRKPITQTCIII